MGGGQWAMVGKEALGTGHWALVGKGKGTRGRGERVYVEEGI
jgi:hypothetical protein